jgi:hypothetical protein
MTKHNSRNPGHEDGCCRERGIPVEEIESCERRQARKRAQAEGLRTGESSGHGGHCRSGHAHRREDEPA